MWGRLGLPPYPPPLLRVAVAEEPRPKARRARELDHVKGVVLAVQADECQVGPTRQSPWLVSFGSIWYSHNW
jgi:hypothetical protein